MKINSYNDWDPLREVVVGNPESRASLTFSNLKTMEEEKIKRAIQLAEEAFPNWMQDAVNEDLEELCTAIRDYGAKILRPETKGLHGFYQTPFWASSGTHCYNVRDLHLVLGNTLIESPSHMQNRYFESTGLYDVFYKYFEEGFKWVSGPKPRLIGNYKIKYEHEGKEYSKLSEEEILFEAANTARFGRDLLYLVSKSGNYKAAKWLQSVAGEEFRVHTTESIYRSSHIDSTVICLRPGLVLLNATRVNDENMPDLLKTWDKIYVDEILPYPSETVEFHKTREKIHSELLDMGIESNANDLCSEWVGVNLFSLDESTVIADKRQLPLIKILEGHGFTVIPVNARHSYFMGGAFHCCTLDTVREGVLENYFD